MNLGGVGGGGELELVVPALGRVRLLQGWGSLSEDRSKGGSPAGAGSFHCRKGAILFELLPLELLWLTRR
jgi:hypothetical protein